MSVATLSAKPCMVRPCASRTPMAQILRGSGPLTPTHTPGYSGRQPTSATTEFLQRVHHEALDGAHVVARAQRVGHVHDGVPDQLAGTVIGDVAAALHRHQIGTDRRRIDEHVGGQIGTRTVREHVRMLEQQQVVAGAVLEQRLLQRERLAVRHASEPADAQRTGGHADSELRGPVAGLELDA